MAEYIEREAAIDCLNFVCVPQCRKYAQEEIKKIPAADVQPVRHGRWKYEEKELKSGVVACFHACSVCGYRTNLFVINTIACTPYYFCPNCGAYMMDGEA